MLACTLPEISPFMFTQNCPYKKRRTTHQKPTVRYQVQHLPNEIIVDLKKTAPKETIEHHILSHVRNFQDTIPRYKLVTDWLGNQYYVENDINQETIFNEVLRSINWTQFGINMCKKLFRDYDIQLKHDGKELRVTSKMDGIDQIFELNEEVDDVEIMGLQLSDDLHDAVLKLRLIKKEMQEEKVKSVQCEHKESVHKKEPSEFETKKPSQVTESKEILKRKNRHYHHHHSKNEPRNKTKSNSRKVKKVEKELPTSDDDNTQLEASKPKAFKIDVLFDSSDSEKSENNVNSSNNYDNGVSPPRRNSASSVNSVVLEEVEDEEVRRWQKSLTQTPSGHSVLEDV
ncbi:uncharacterized protein KLLA0_E03763g [Kluyveromyces lactis]|uniref:KLLA0E03763p n=1 Tax=Kluyveromyces lactis (strain ATCC 8585 / CBS 2359 / DSM 70799 / NBRC 1267 / NRRL Y-1140 / WM37) TaxID=284590 RepID=Q6CPM6_KLULA|nr:uncharacterized protein KLLA0_E03763g [Kluyveromyces lactis]CAG99200.1 KLLA0E03763p [Kluyveromyces lactis]|eukprot:XP_454113.1 uncharacterized protein KLLA0_E03763g [Kluyveromyces lactis]